MHRLKTAVFTAIAIFTLHAAAFGQTSKPIPQITHAVIISVDGLRPDLALRANTPNMHALFTSGSFSFWARTTEMSVTLPSHTSMLTGVVPKTHGITFNDDGPEEQVYPKVPTLFEMAKNAGYTTALAATKSKFTTLSREVDWASIPPRGKTAQDDVATDAAVQFLKEHQPGILFLHLGGTDVVGHAIGWATPEQIAAIEHADACIGRLMGTLKELKLLDSTFVLMSADHGGTGKWHGPDEPRARHIPWIISGPGIRKNVDLTIYRELTINTEDTCATTCWLLNIPIDHPIDGKPLMVISEKGAGQLMHDK